MELHRLAAEERTLWDTYVSGHDCGHFMQSYAWGELRALQGWGVERLLAVHNGSPCAAMTVLSKRIPGLNRHIAYVPRGPVFDADQPEALRLLLQTAWATPGNLMLRLDPYFTEDDPRCAVMRACGCAPLSQAWSHWNNPRYVLWLDISAGPEAYLSGASKSFRYQARKPVKDGVVFSTGTAGDLDAFSGLMRQTAKNKHIAVHAPEYYQQVFSTLHPAGMLELFLARYEEQPIAAGMSIKYGKKAWLLYAASAKEHMKLGASLTLQLRMLEWAMAAGCTRYDFRGSATSYPPKPTDPGYGVYEFKKKFGPEFTILAPYYDFSPGLASSLFSKTFEHVAVPLIYRLARLKNA